VVQKGADGAIHSASERRPAADLPEGDVLLRVDWSSLNYKDALSATGHPGVTKRFPHVPGIDAAGQVIESRSERFRQGDQVIVGGADFGTAHWGGWAELARVPADWVLPLPAGLTPCQSMIHGTAGFTAAMSLAALERRAVDPAGGPVLVTGASGGVGSIAVALLAKAGFEVEAATGKPSAHELLRRLGAAKILGREDVADTSARPLLAARWTAVVDNVGGNILASAIRATRPGGCVTACGLTAGAELPLTVYPFILRGVELVGIDSAGTSLATREALWAKLAGPWKLADLESLATTVPLSEVQRSVQEILEGRITGRVVVKIS